jgi:protein-S-isoprenylcysteine O-methyltransferase Ste14
MNSKHPVEAIRGGIAGLAANIISKNGSYERGCHGELVAVPDTAIARWIKGEEDMDIRNRWISFLYRVATGARKTRTLITPVGIVLFGAYTSLFAILAVLVDQWLSLPWPLSTGLSLIIAVSLIAVGAGMTAWSVSHFLKVKGTPVPFNPPPTLVMTGPYRFVRNPMLTGVFLLLFGMGFSLKSLSLVVLFTPLFVWANVWELKEIEEPELVKRLGEDYVAYQQQVPMFLPNVRCGRERCKKVRQDC